MVAPYCGSSLLNFPKLHGYISVTFDTQKEHVWALREDPSYFADTVWGYEEHTHPGNLTWSLRLSDKLSYQSSMLANIAVEAYTTLAESSTVISPILTCFSDMMQTYPSR
jgi:hypothetical protein